MMLSLLPTAAFASGTNPFSDVKAGDWFCDEVLYVKDNGLMNGIGDNKFGPDMQMDRAMLVTVLYRLNGEPEVSGENKFADVKEGSYYHDAVIWANENKITTGYDDGTFKPHASVTREQMAAFLYRYAEYLEADVSASADLGSYPDAAKVSSWAKDAMEWAVGAGIINGTDGKLDPAGYAIRAQVATVLMRFCELYK